MTLSQAHHKSIVKARVKTLKEVRGGREVISEKGQCENPEGWTLARDKGWKKEILAVIRFLHHENANKIIAIRVLRLFTFHF